MSSISITPRPNWRHENVVLGEDMARDASQESGQRSSTGINRPLQVGMNLDVPFQVERWNSEITLNLQAVGKDAYKSYKKGHVYQMDAETARRTLAYIGQIAEPAEMTYIDEARGQRTVRTARFKWLAGSATLEGHLAALPTCVTRTKRVLISLLQEVTYISDGSEYLLPSHIKTPNTSKGLLSFMTDSQLRQVLSKDFYTAPRPLVQDTLFAPRVTREPNASMILLGFTTTDEPASQEKAVNTPEPQEEAERSADSRREVQMGIYSAPKLLKANLVASFDETTQEDIFLWLRSLDMPIEDCVVGDGVSIASYGYREWEMSVWPRSSRTKAREEPIHEPVRVFVRSVPSRGESPQGPTLEVTWWPAGVLVMQTVKFSIETHRAWVHLKICCISVSEGCRHLLLWPQHRGAQDSLIL